MSRKSRIKPSRAALTADIARRDPAPRGHATGYRHAPGYALKVARIALRRLDDGSKAYRRVLRDLDTRIGSE